MEEGTQILEISSLCSILKTPVANTPYTGTPYSGLTHPPGFVQRSIISAARTLPGTTNFLFRVCRSSFPAIPRYLNGIVNHGTSTVTPAFTAVQVRRPSGRFHGVLNIAAAVYSSTDFSLLNGLSAICFRDLMQEKSGRWRRRRLSRGGSKRSEQSGSESCDFSDGAIAAEMAEKKDLKSDSGGLLWIDDAEKDSVASVGSELEVLV
ncbi:hypothetical protein HAX54_044332 [Datura stramonium]|uniref:Uncharacterized protein n=1 Tax=Datura stramonium TaxID=4076 RepID=A0ABS8SP27_DATST|nr:hypothetical protein [Datura stramonium]